MPPRTQPNPGGTPRPSTTIDKQIASSNATATAFLGGRQQPAWMTSGAALITNPAIKKPTPRRRSVAPAVQQQSQQPQQAQPPPPQPAVLPSPAPSDEPSPALSNVLESPKSHASSLTEAPTMGSTSTPTLAAPTLPLSDARFAPTSSPGPDVQEVPRPGAAGPVPPNVGPALPHVEGRARPYGGHMVQVTNGAQDSQDNSHNQSMSLARSPARTPLSGPQPPPKRQRTEYSGPSPTSLANVSTLLPILEQYVRSYEGDRTLDAAVIRPRVMILTEACKKEDRFFIILHQLFVLWSLNASEAYAALGLEPATINYAFTILETVLRKNQLMAPAHQMWFSRFPVPSGGFGREHVENSTLLAQIAGFLASLANDHDALLAAALRRGYPFLVDELLGRLHCYSPVLQFILFTSCRRHLGVPDADYGLELEKAFRDDLLRHRDPATGLPAISPLTHPGDIEQRNSQLILFYRHVVAAASFRASGQATPQSPALPSTSSPLQAPQQAAPNSFPSVRVAQPRPPVPSAISIPNPFPAVYPSSALPFPSQSPKVTMNPYTTAQPGASGTGTAWPALPSSNPQVVQQPRQATQTAAPQHRVVDNNNNNNNAPNRQSGLAFPHHMLPQQQAMAPAQPPVLPSQFFPTQSSPISHQQLFNHHQLIDQQQILNQQQPLGQQQPLSQQQILNQQQLLGQQQILNQQLLLGQQQPLGQQQLFNQRQLLNQQQHQHNLQVAAHSSPQPGPPTQRGRPRRASVAPQPGLYPQPGFLTTSQSPTYATRGDVQPGQNIQMQQMQYNPWAQQVEPAINAANPTNHGVQPGLTPAPRPSAHQAPQQGLPPIVTDPLLMPPLGTLITRTEWPYDPSDRKALLMSLHQAHVRSPTRVIKKGETERCYQATKLLPLEPTPIAPKETLYEFRFQVAEDQLPLAAIGSRVSAALLPVVEHSNGSLRWRIRCCMVSTWPEAPAEQDWVTLDTSWPCLIHMMLNDKVLEIRRHTHNGRDLPIEVTDMVVAGTNVLEIAFHEAPGEGIQNRLLAVEMLETFNHSTIVNSIWSRGIVPEVETLDTIRGRLTSSTDDDVAFEAPDLSIDLADPFSSTIFKIPVRGDSCTHMECFDLENWLNTRPAKTPVKCSHKPAQCACVVPVEPSNPDKWRCPICSKDARPCSLRIDGFLLKVRRQLEEEGKLHTKCLRVKADGSWSVVLEDGDDGASDDDGPVVVAGPSRATAATPPSLPAVRRTSQAPAARRMPQAPVAMRREVEIIEID